MVVNGYSGQVLHEFVLEPTDNDVQSYQMPQCPEISLTECCTEYNNTLFRVGGDSTSLPHVHEQIHPSN